SVAGHWTVTYVTHNPGPGNWLVPEAGVQASNLPGWGFLTMGECWHNNHHAYPRMARHGHKWWEIDPTFAVIRLLRLTGLAWDVVDYRNAAEKKEMAAAKTANGN
ncbi:MAG: acyl-CoA desaturase, partial [Planctomycetota bacterium]